MPGALTTAADADGLDGVDGIGGTDVVVLAGGRSSRLGRDKAAVVVGGLPLLDRVLRAAAPVGGRLLVAGPERPLLPGTPVPTWCREDPPGGGPVAGVAAALARVRTPRVFVLAVDLPFLTVDALRVLAAAGPAAFAIDAAGVDQGLLGVWPTAALRAAMPTDPAGRSWRRITAGIPAARVRLPGDPAPETDCDTAADVARARSEAGDETGPVTTAGDTEPDPATGDTEPDALDAWVLRVRSELDLPDVDATALLDLARDVAHGVARPAAPLTTFLVGLAAGRSGGRGDDVSALVARVRALLSADWAERP